MPALIGFDMLHYALLQDGGDNVSTGKATYGTPKRIYGAVTGNINPNSAVDTLFADNGPMDTASALGKIDGEFGAAEFPPEDFALMLGHSYVSGMVVRKGTDVPPWLAVGGRALKSNGAYRYFWLVKGKMMDPEEKNETKGDKVNFQTPTLKGSFVKRDCDDIWKIEYDTDSPDFQQSVIDQWFTKVLSPDDLPLGCTVSPVDGATGVLTSANLVVTFSKAISAALAISDNFTLATVATPGTPLAATVSINTADTVVTIDPTTDLTAATQYQLTIKATTGLTTDKVVKFTTA